ncbi:MAG: hypothetical protein WDO73_04490 [Ignavibacteriota bacterium]
MEAHGQAHHQLGNAHEGISFTTWRAPTRPERLNLWSAIRPAAAAFGSSSLASLNYVWEDAPPAAPEADGAVSFFYHTFPKPELGCLDEVIR